jgi:hypothetical protein
MFLTLRFDETLDFPKPGETQLRLDLLDASPLRSFFNITLIRLKEGTTDQVQTRELRSGDFLKTDSKAAQQRELFNVFGAALIAAKPEEKGETL